MNQKTSKGHFSPRRLAVVVATLGLLCGAPLAATAQTNNASPTGVANANQNAIDHSNVNGVGAAPVPETATWVAMATLVGAAGFARWRRKAAKSN